jgi:hypothetical protein
MLNALGVFVEAFVGRWHKVGTIAILKRRERAGHDRWFSKLSNRLSGSGYSARG